MSDKALQTWPYKHGPEFMTPDVVWSAYVHENRLRRLWEVQLAHCAARIHNQRAEINRLAAEVERLKRHESPNDRHDAGPTARTEGRAP